MPLDAGKLRHRVTLQRAVEAHVDGEVRRRWTTLATVWASVDPLEAGEAVEAGSVRGEVTHRVLIRYRADVEATMRLVHRARFFELAGPPRDVEEAHEYLELLCKEVA